MSAEQILIETLMSPVDDIPGSTLLDQVCLSESVSVSKALAGPDRDKWLEAIMTERKALEKMKVFKRLRRADLPHGKINITNIAILLNKKEDGRFKARGVALGNRLTHDASTYSPVPRLANWRLLMKLAASGCETIQQHDISTAFLYASLREEDGRVFVVPPPEWRETPDEVWELQRALYGLRSAPALFYRTLADTLRKSWWEVAENEPCLFFSPPIPSGRRVKLL